MIDVIELTRNKKDKAYILSKVSTAEIITHFYKGDLILNKAIPSPLREDKNPSFVFYRNKNNDITFFDFGTGKRGSAFDFVMELFNVSFYDAIEIIVSEFNLDNSSKHAFSKSKATYQKEIKVKERCSIGFKRRKFNKDDILYWNSFGIKLKTLELFNVYPISYIFYGEYSFKADKYAYVYIEKINDIPYIKIYQPYNKKTKWLSNMPMKVLFGYTRIPETGNLLIITKALKEIMSLYDTLGIPSIGVQQENVIIKEEVLGILKKRFKKIITLFDNDKQGKQLYNKYLKLGIDGLILEESKNYSDLIESIGIKKSKIIIKHKLKL